MDKKFIVVFLVLVLGILSSSLVVSVGTGIEVLNCGVNASSLIGDCLENITVRCSVVDSVSGSMGVNSVVFGVTGYKLDGTTQGDVWAATLRSGTVLNGVWEANFAGGNAEYNLTPASAEYSEWRIDSVEVKNAGGTYCYSTVNKQDTNCFINWTENRTIDNGCACGASSMAASCTIWNLKNVSWTYDPICEGIYDTSLAFCDYCDPLWTPVYGACVATNIVGYPGMTLLTGSSSKSYVNGVGVYPNGTDCCDRTISAAGQIQFNHNGGSDCDVPGDLGAVTCWQDVWLRQGNTVNNSNRKALDMVGAAPAVDYSFSDDYTDFTAYYGVPYQPMVFDIDSDGYQEIMVSKDNELRSYTLGSSGSILLDDSETFGTFNFVGRPALYGIERDDYPFGTGFFCSDASTPPCSISYVSMVNISASSDIKMAFFNYTLGNNLTSTAFLYNVSANSSVACYGTYCYAKDVKNRGYRVSALTGTVDTVNLQGLGAFDDPTPYAPIFFDIDEDGTVEVVWYGTTASADGVYVCSTNLDLTNLDCPVISTPNSGSITGALVQTDDAGYPAFIFTDVRASGAYVTYGLKKISYQGGVELTYSKDLWTGLTPACLSAPADASCGDNKNGIGLLHYNGPSSTAAVVAPPFTGSADLGTNPVSSTTLYPGGDAYRVPEYQISDVGSDNYEAGNSVPVAATWAFAGDMDMNGVPEIILVTTSSIIVYNQDLSTSLSSYSPTGTLITAPLFQDMDQDGYLELMFFTSNLNGSFYVLKLNSTPALELEKNITGVFNLSKYPIQSGRYIEDSHYDRNMFIWNTASYPYLWKIESNGSDGDYGYINATISISGGLTSDSYVMSNDAEMGNGNGRDLLISAYNVSWSGSDIIMFDYDTSLVQRKEFNITFATGSAPYILSAVDEEWSGSSYGEIIVISAIGYTHYARKYDYNGVYTGYGVGPVTATGGAAVDFGVLADNPSVISLNIANYAGYILYSWSIYDLDFLYSTYTPYGYDSWFNYDSSHDLYNSIKFTLTNNNAIPEWRKFITYRGEFLNPGNGTNPIYTFTNGSNISSASSTMIKAIYDFDSDGRYDVLMKNATATRILYQDPVPVVTSTTSYAECISTDKTNALVTKRKYPLSGSSCEVSSLSSVDTNNDGWSEFVTGLGVLDMTTGTTTASGAQFGGGDMVMSSLDLDSNGYMDYLGSANGRLVARLLTPPAQSVLPSAVIGLNRLSPSCLVTNGNTVSVGIWGQASDLSKVTYSVDWDGDGEFDQTEVYPNYLLTHTYTVSYNYTITARICDTSLSPSCDTATCQAEVDVNEAGTSGSCSLGDEGEFNWFDLIYNHGWFDDSYSLAPDGNILTADVSGSAYTAVHAASCNLNQLTAKFNASFSSDVDSYVWLSAPSTSGAGADTPLAGFSFKDGYMYTFSRGNIGAYTADTLAEYSIFIDISANEYELSVLDLSTGVVTSLSSGALSASASSLMQANVWFAVDWGSVDFDYIRIIGGGTKIPVVPVGPGNQTLPDEYFDERACDITKLGRCSETGDLSFFNGSRSDSMVNSAYPDLYDFCLSCDSQYCDYALLQKILQKRPSCAKQVNAYCVDITYPADVGIASDEVNTEGATTCAIMLSSSQIYNKMVTPIYASIWTLFTSNIIMVMGLIAGVLLIIAVAGNRKK